MYRPWNISDDLKMIIQNNFTLKNLQTLLKDMFCGFLPVQIAPGVSTFKVQKIKAYWKFVDYSFIKP